MRSHTFFGKTDTTQKERFFNPADQGSADDGFADASNQDQTGAQGPRFDEYKYRQLRFNPPQDPDELLRKLLTAALKGKDVSKELLALFKNNPRLVNRVPKNFERNALEVMLEIGDMNVAKQLYHQFKARVQSNNLEHYLSQLFKLDSSLQPEIKRNYPPRLVR